MYAKFRALIPESVVTAVRPALMTAFFTFLAIFATALVGFLQEVSGWLETFGSPEASDFPDPSVLGVAAISGVTAALAGLTNFVIRWVQVVKGWGNVPSYKA